MTSHSKSIVYDRPRNWPLYEIYALGCAFFLSLKLVEGNKLDLLAIGFAVLLWNRSQQWWALVFGLAIPLFGFNPVAYTAVPLEGFLLATGFLEFSCRVWDKNFGEIEYQDINSRIQLLAVMAFAFVLWTFFRNNANILLLISECRSWGARECVREVFLAHSGSPLRGIRVSLSWFLGSVSFLLLVINQKAQQQLMRGLAFSIIAVLLLGLRHLNLVTLSEKFCADSYVCRIVLNPPDHFNQRFVSVFGNPGWYGQFILYGMPFLLTLAIYFAKQGQSRRALVFTLAGLLALAEGVGTAQRASWLGIGVFGCSFLFFLWRFSEDFFGRKRPWLVGMLAVLGVLTTVVGFFLIEKSMRLYKLRFESWGREAIWQTIPLMMKDHWILGRGTGLFKESMENTRAANGMSHIVYETAHNEVLNIIVETGLIGAVLFLIFVLFAGILLLKSKGSFKKWMLIATALGVGANLLFQEISYIRSLNYLFWIFLSFIAVSSTATEFAPLKQPRVSWKIKSAVVIGIKVSGLLMILLFYVFLSRPAYSGCYLKERGDAGIFRWCSRESVFYFPDVEQGVEIQVNTGFCGKDFRYSYYFSKGSEKSDPVQVGPLFSGENQSGTLKIARNAPASLQDIVVRFHCSKAEVTPDYRELSYVIGFPERRL